MTTNNFTSRTPNLLTDSIFEDHVGGGISVQNHLKLLSVDPELNSTTLLTSTSTNVKSTRPEYLRSPSLNQFFDDFAGCVVSVDRVGNTQCIFDTIWQFFGTNSQVLLKSSGLDQLAFTNGVQGLNYDVSIATGGNGGVFSLNSLSMFNTSNGDITYECVFYMLNANLSYYDSLHIFLGLGQNTILVNASEMDLYAGFIFDSSGVNFKTVYDITPSTDSLVSFTTSNSFIQASTTLWKLKMIIKATTIEYYIDGVLVHTATATFPSNSIMMPRIWFSSDNSTGKPPNNRAGIFLDYVYVSQAYNRSFL